VCRRRSMPSQDIAKVFNTLYSEDCILAGYQNGIALGSLNAQWQEHKKSTCKGWQEALASSEAELEVSRKQIVDCLVENPSHVQSTPASRRGRSNPRWKTSTTNNRVQIFDAHGTPCSAAATAVDVDDEDTINVATEPLTPPESPALRVQKPPVQTQKPAQVLVVIEPSLVASTQPTRKVFNKSPRTMISAERTRTIKGKQVPIIGATDPDLVVEDPVLSTEAHSPVPELLFRFYDDDSQGVRTRDGEICGRYAYQTCNPPSPPPCDDDRMFVSALSHLNQDETASELISTSSSLFFVMREAAKSDANPHICVIRGSAMPKNKIFHMSPYHKKFEELILFYGGKYRCPSSHEYAVWATIPRTAIIHNFAFADLERHLIGNPYMSSIFRIDRMRTIDGRGTIEKGFKQDKLGLTLAAIEGIARLMPQFGITVTSPAPIIARLISEIIRDFVIELPKTTPSQWDVLGRAFAYALSHYANQTYAAEIDLIRAKSAFLSGARLGLGERNWHLKPKEQTKMINKGLALGLGANQSELDTERLESAKRFRKNIARFSYNEKNAELDQDTMMDEDDTLVDEDDDDEENDSENDEEEDTLVEIENEEVTTDIEEHIETDIEEAETDIEEAITVKTPPPPQRTKVSVVIEASQPSKKVNEIIIISDSSDDEDYIADTDNEEDIDTDECNFNEPAKPGPRLSQRMPSSTNTDDRPRRRTQTPPIYNFSRADEIFDEIYEITDQSEDED
jgi:hypothetical protein